MEFVIEFICELFFDGMIELAMNRNLSKWIRYPIMGVIGLFYFIVIAGLFYLGIITLKTSFVGFSIIMLIDFVIIIGTIYGFRKRMKQQISE